MLRLLADEDFDNDILRGVFRRVPAVDLVRAQDVGLAETLDPLVLEAAAEEGRVVLSHDVSTMRPAAYERVAAGLPMPGLFLVPQSMPIGTAIEELVILVECSREGEWEGRVEYLPL